MVANTFGSALAVYHLERRNVNIPPRDGVACLLILSGIDAEKVTSTHGHKPYPLLLHRVTKNNIEQRFSLYMISGNMIWPIINQRPTK